MTRPLKERLVARHQLIRLPQGEVFDGDPINPDGPEALARIERLEAALDSCSAALQRLHTDIEALMAESAGVAGLHHNGDVATWEELGEGGRFSDWVGEPLWAARNAWQDARAALSEEA